AGNLAPGRRELRQPTGRCPPTVQSLPSDARKDAGEHRHPGPTPSVNTYGTPSATRTPRTPRTDTVADRRGLCHRVRRRVRIDGSIGAGEAAPRAAGPGAGRFRCGRAGPVGESRPDPR